MFYTNVLFSKIELSYMISFVNNHLYNEIKKINERIGEAEELKYTSSSEFHKDLDKELEKLSKAKIEYREYINKFIYIAENDYDSYHNKIRKYLNDFKAEQFLKSKNEKSKHALFNYINEIKNNINEVINKFEFPKFELDFYTKEDIELYTDEGLDVEANEEKSKLILESKLTYHPFKPNEIICNKALANLLGYERKLKEFWTLMVYNDKCLALECYGSDVNIRLFDLKL